MQSKVAVSKIAGICFAVGRVAGSTAERSLGQGGAARLRRDLVWRIRFCALARICFA